MIEIYLRCDRCGRKYEHPHSRLEFLEKHAKKDGWYIDPRQQLCPDCWFEVRFFSWVETLDQVVES